MKGITSRQQKNYLKKIMDKIAKNDPQTTDIVLKDLRFGHEHFAIFVLSLVTNTHVQKLFIHNAGINSAQAHLLACALQQNKSLEHLSLKDNEIGSTGAESIASALCDNRSLKTLGLTNNKIGNHGGKRLLRMLRENESICEVFLEGNNISDKILVKINDCCRASPEVRARRRASRKSGGEGNGDGRKHLSDHEDVGDQDSTTYASSDYTPSHASRKSESNESDGEERFRELANLSNGGKGTSFEFANISIEDFNASGLDLASYIKRVNLMSMDARDEEEAFLREMESSDMDLTCVHNSYPDKKEKKNSKKSMLKSLGWSKLSRKASK